MRTLFLAANVLIAVDYLLIGIYFLQRAPVLRRKHAGHREVRTIIACWAAGLFFFGCMHTHIDLVLLDHSEHWHSWWNVLSHVAQGIGGFTFWYLARHHLVLNIFDKKTYDSAVDQSAEERLEVLALKVGLARK